jgi:hypothetical protein
MSGGACSIRRMTKRALLLFTAVIGLCIAAPTLLSSCGGVDCTLPANANSAACVAGAVIQDCTAVDISAALAKYGPIVEQEITNAPRNPDGSIDWTSIAGVLETQVAEAGFCVISELFSKYLLPAPPVAVGSGAAPPAKMTPSAADVRGEFEKLRAEHAPGKKIKTSRGII